MTDQKRPNFYRLPQRMPMAETDVSLRAYLSRVSDEPLAQYDPRWNDEQVIDWDGNFKFDGKLMLVCCKRDVDVEEFRRVLAEHVKFRFPGNNRFDPALC